MAIEFTRRSILAAGMAHAAFVSVTGTFVIARAAKAAEQIELVTWALPSIPILFSFRMLGRRILERSCRSSRKDC